MLSNRIKALNNMAEYLNKVAPVIFAHAAKGYKINNDGQMSKKDKAAFSALLGQYAEPENAQVWISTHNYNNAASLEYKAHYMTGECTCAYVSYSVYLDKPDIFQPLPVHDYDAIVQELAQARELCEKAQDMRDIVSRIESITAERLYWPR